MINHLDIKGFLTFEELHIPTLKRVNLIAGRNNSGKTALLEAIRLYSSAWNNTTILNAVINNILNSRGLLIKGWDESYESLHNWNSPSQEELFSINHIKLLGPNKKKSFYEIHIFEPSDIDHLTLRLNTQNSAQILKESCIYVPFDTSYNKLNQLWENIALTPKEDDVIKILQESIEPKLIRFSVGQNEVKIRLDGNSQPIPLASLGDGVQRILFVALSLANAQGKYLLIDEIELGLHYSVLETLWEMIFKYAKAWNIQVFATTHSQDTIRAFHYVASQEKYTNDAQYIRLQHGRNGVMKPLFMTANV